MGSYHWKTSRRKIIFSALLIGCFALLICMSLILEGEAYYVFAANTPLGTLLYLASALRYLGDINTPIILDISYLVILLGLICSVAISIKKSKTIRVVYVVCACDIVFSLLLFNIIGIVADIVIIVIATRQSKEED